MDDFIDRYRATIYVDFWAENGHKAGRKLEKLMKGIPNCHSDGVSKLTHGSDISLDK